jgi:general secretion pathway protein F
VSLFQYKAASSSGTVEQGELEARDQAAAVERLQSMGYIPIRIEAGGVETNSGGLLSGSSLFSRKAVSQDELGNLTRELSTLLRAGLSLDRALELLLNMAENPPLRAMILKIRDDVRGGAALSSAMELHPAVFGRFYLSMIKAGEAGGALGSVLARISEFMERSKELKETVKSALIYPTILIFVAVVSIMLLLTLVVPQFSQMFQESGKALPFATQIVVSAGDFLRQYWWTLFAVGFLLYRYYKWQMGNPTRRYRWDKKILNLPLIGDLVTKIEIARFARTLSTLLGNGVSLLPAMTIVKDTVSNLVVVTGIETVRNKLKEGRGLGKPLMEEGIFPTLAIHMVMVGEETGSLGEMLNRVADVYDKEVQTAVKRMLALLEPVMILGLGLVIGGIIMSILMAILKVNSLVA